MLKITKTSLNLLNCDFENLNLQQCKVKNEEAKLKIVVWFFVLFIHNLQKSKFLFLYFYMN